MADLPQDCGVLLFWPNNKSQCAASNVLAASKSHCQGECSRDCFAQDSQRTIACPTSMSCRFVRQAQLVRRPDCHVYHCWAGGRSFSVNLCSLYRLVQHCSFVSDIICFRLWVTFSFKISELGGPQRMVF